MNDVLGLLVFTDLDGTLLDHETYDWSPAKPALAALESAGAGLVLASSKTAVEMAVLRKALQWEHWPSIVENGAGVLPANVDEVPGGGVYKALRDTLNQLPEHLRSSFQGFGDMSDADVQKLTGLNIAAARLARNRAFSEPGVWHGSEPDREDFLSQLLDEGIKAVQGGRFLTLSFGANKADRVRELVQTFKPARTIALGDAPNDIEMLETTDVGVIIANHDANPLPELSGEAEGRIIRTTEPGPSGWNGAVLDLIKA